MRHPVRHLNNRRVVLGDHADIRCLHRHQRRPERDLVVEPIGADTFGDLAAQVQEVHRDGDHCGLGITSRAQLRGTVDGRAASPA